MILPAHKNARYTVRIQELENADPKLHDPEGVPVHGVIYGGRDSDTSVPVYQSFDWAHGVYAGATVESETTAATLGQAGVRKSSPMANMDFLVVPLGKYIKNHLTFGDSCSKTPLVFATNYFLKEDGKFLNEKVEKKVWLMWMEGRVHGEYDALKTPVGHIPLLKDIQELFKQVFDREYTEKDYIKQFSIRVDKFLEKIERMKAMYDKEDDVPQEFWDVHNMLEKNLKEAKEKFGSDVIEPTKFA